MSPSAPDFDLTALLGPNGRLASAIRRMCRPASTPSRRCGSWACGTRVSPRLAPAADVRSALLLVERGEAPAGIVYATDAAVSKAVTIAGVFPESSHDPITYPFAVTKAGDTPGGPRLPGLPIDTGGTRGLDRKRLQGRIGRPPPLARRPSR